MVKILSFDCMDGRMSRCGNGYGGADGTGWSKCKCPGLSKGNPRIQVYSIAGPGPMISDAQVDEACMALTDGVLGINAIRLVTHSDCGASKLALGLTVPLTRDEIVASRYRGPESAVRVRLKRREELTLLELERVEAHTANRRELGVERLLADHRFRHCLDVDRLPFRVGNWDIEQHAVVWIAEYDPDRRRMIAVPASSSLVDTETAEADQAEIQEATVRGTVPGHPHGPRA